MEHLEFELKGGSGVRVSRESAIVGVVASGNLEVLVEKQDFSGACKFVINTSAKGFGAVWKAVLEDFLEKSPAQDLLFSINDNAATPAVVSIRLLQAYEAISG